ncbi:hemagglutinin repeat-containing protein [Pectobacterium brasiliense]|uniref:hemagglutinin repeat-containing protein n=1 Tax=Pectobacterium brasiliense TaxID=180957 RepID=UPI000D3F2835|nr:hemagglutinin repeat-containing protein [Pectobacterium brasiliense]PPE64673.1 hemolysin BL-binding protein [Pectobacterium brasiliense]
MKPIKTTQRLLAYTLIHLIAFQPLLPAMAAGVQVATGNTALDQAGNGVPVINIATPNSAGISHNQYHDFNVDKPGLILNNGTEQLNPTQLGGLIQNNPNLKGKAADAIINEVVSSNRSTLAGYLEVGGKQASVIVANPNGITCDGCGFINTPQVTLTTGKPQLDAQGNLQHIDVKRGDITLTGQGLDASKSDYLSLIARTAQIDAGLNANDARIVLGANQVDATGKVTAQATDSGVKVALDTGALGGMYTNRIKLVSSDKGVGVNVGNLSARSGDITLSANGKLSLGDAVAKGSIQADADALALRGKQQAGDALTLNAKQDITLQDATLRAGKDIALRSDGTLNAQNSLISAGVDAQGTVKSANHLSLKGDAVTLNATQLAAGKVTVGAGQSLQQDAQSGIKAESVLDVHGDAVSLAGSAGAEDVRLEAKTLNGAGSAQLQAKNNATVRVTQQGDWQGNVTAGNTLSVEGGQLLQRGTLAGKTLTLTLEALDNQGDIAALQALTFSGGNITNRGTLAAAERLTVNAQRLDNSGLLSARHEVKLELQAVLNNQGNILTDNQLFLLAGNITNGGTLQAATLTAQADSFTSQGEVTANALDLTSQTTENHGTINARQMLALHGGSLVNRGMLSAGEKLALTLGDTLDNRSLMQAGNTLQITADRLSNDGTLTAPDLQLHTGSFANQGSLQADNALQLDATRSLTQSAHGTLLAGTGLTINAGQAETDGAVQAQQFLLNAERWLNTGKTSMTGDGLITAGQLDNRGSLLTAGNWTIHSDAASNAGVLQGNTLTIQANTLTSSGQAQAKGTVNLTVADTFTNSGDWLSGETLRLQAAQTENRGSLQALTLTTDGTSFDNRGTVSGINNLSLFLTGHLDNAGTLQGNELRADAAQLDNQGTLRGTDALTLAITGNLSNQGELLSDGDSTTTTQRFINQGTLQAKNVVLQVDELDNAGKILGVSSLALTAANGLTNRQTGKLLSQGAAMLTAAEGVNTGEWQAKALTLTANNLTNDGQIQGDEALSLTLPATDGKGTLINRGTLTTGGDATLFARLMENQGTLSSLGRTELTAVSLMNDGRVVAATGLSLRGDYQGRGLLNTAGTLTLHGDTLVNGGHWESRALSLQGKHLTNQGTVLGNTVALSLDQLTNHGDITGVDALTLSLGDSLNNIGTLRSDSLSVAAADVNNRGDMQGINTLQLNTTGLLDNTGVISGSQSVAVTAGDVKQRGTLEGKTVTLDAASLTNQGKMLGVDALTLAIVGTVTNSGNVLTQGTGSVTAQQVDNSGLMQAGSLTLQADDIVNAGQLLGIDALSITAQHGLTNQQNGTLLTQGAAVLQAAQVANHGEWRADSLSLRAARFTNAGRVQTEGNMDIVVEPAGAPHQRSFLPMALSLATDIQQLNAPSSRQSGGATDGVLDNRGTLVSGGDIQLRATQLANQGSLASNGTATLIGETVANDGDIVAVTGLSLAGHYQGRGSLQTDGLLDWSGATLTNRGRWQANAIQLQGLTLDNQGTLLGQRTDITVDSLFNSGEIAGVDALQLTVADSLTNQGQIYGAMLGLSATDLLNQGELSGDRLHLTLQETVRNRGLMSGSQRVQLEANQVDQSGSLESRLLQVQANALDNQGTMLGVDALTLSIRDTARNQGKLLSQGTSTLTANRLENRGQWQAKTLTLTADDVGNAGQLLGLSALSLTAKNRLDNAKTGTLFTQGLAVLNAAEASNDGEWQADSLTLDAQQLTNTGHIQGDQSLTLTLANGDVDNKGTLWSKYATIAARTLTNAGEVTGVDGLQLTLDDALTNQGALSSYHLTAQAGRLDNRGKINGLDRLELTAGNSLDNTGSLYGAALALNASDLTNSGTLTGVDSLSLNLNGTLNNTRDISSTALTLKANDVVNHGTMTGVNGLTLALGNHLDNQGALNSQALAITANDLTNDGQINGTRSLQLTLGDGLTNTGALTSQRIDITAQDVLNHGQMLGSDDLQFDLRNKLDNRGLISGSTTLGIVANDIDQQGTLEARALTVDAQTLDNHGKMLGVDALTLAIADTARNQGKWLSQGSSTLTADRVDNHGQWQAGDITLQANDLVNSGQIFGLNTLLLTTTNDLGNQQGGTLLSQGIAVLRAANVINDGDVQADRLTFDAQQLTNRGRIQGDHGLAVTLDRANPASLLTNQGTLLSGGDGWLSASLLDNQGTVSGVGTLMLDGGAINNAGSVIADGALSLNGDYQGAGLLHTADTLTLRGNQLNNSGRWESRALALNGGTFDNDGTVIGERGITLELRDGLTVGSTGQLLTNGALQAQADTVMNDGRWQGNTLTLTADDVENAGQLLGLSALTLTAKNRLDNTQNGKLLTQGQAVLNAAEASNEGEWQADGLTLDAQQLTNTGHIQGEQSLTLANGDVDNKGTLWSKYADIAARTLTNAGNITGVDGLQLMLDDALTNQGALSSYHLTAQADRLNNSGKINGLDRLELTVGNSLDNQGSLYGTALVLNANDLTNSGTLTGVDSLTLDLTGTLNNTRDISSTALTLRANDVFNHGTLTGVNGLTLELGNQLDNQGALNSQALIIAARDVTNGGLLNGTRDLQLTLDGTLTNTGDLTSQRIDITAKDVLNHGQVLGSDDLQFDLRNTLDNRGLISGSTTLGIVANDIDQQGTLEARALTVDAQTLDNHGKMLGVDALTLAITGTARNQGNWLSQGTSTLTADRVDNNGGRWQAGDITLQASELTNRGQIFGLNTLSLTTTNDLGNQQGGTLLSQGIAVLRAANVINDGDVQADRLTFDAQQLTNRGRMQGDHGLAVTLDRANPASRLTNQGTLLSGGDGWLSASLLDNQGTVSGVGTLTLDGGAINNAGNVIADGALTLNGDYQGAGLLHTADTLTLRGNQLNNSGRWESRALALNGGAFSNTGTVIGERGITLALRDDLTVGSTGQLLTNGGLQAQAGTVVNDGRWQGNTLTLTADEVGNAGQLLGLSALSLSAKNRLDNAKTGQLLTQGLAVLNAAEASNEGEWQADSLTLDAQQLTNTGHIQGDQSLKLTLANGDVANQGTLWSTLATIAARTLTNAGNITGVDGLQLTLDDALTNQGALSSYHLTAQADRLDNRGKINGLDRLELTVGNSLDNQGSLYGTALVLNANDLTNHGTLTGVDSLTLGLNGTLNNTRDISSTALTLRANDVVNRGTMTGVNGLTLELGNQLDNQGALNSQALAISANDLTNDGQINGTRDLQLTLDGTLTNTGDLSSQRIGITAKDVLNHGQVLGSDDLQFDLRNTLDNRGLISGSTTLGIVANDIDQQGTLEARALTVDAQTLDNHGKMLGVDALTLAITGTARNQGKWLSQGTSTLTADRVDNHGQWQAGDITLQASELTNRGQIFGLNALSLTATNGLTNQQNAKLLSQGIAVLRAASVTNDGDVQADRLTFEAQQLTNRGRMQGDHGLAIALDRTNPVSRLTNQGTLLSGGDSWLSASQLDNQGTVSGVGTLTLDSGAINNAGSVIADGALTLTGDYQGAGLLHTADTLTLRGNQLRNNGRWESRTLALNGGSFSNAGTVIGERSITLELRDGLTVGSTGQLLTNGVLQAQAGTVMNDGFWQGKTLELSANDLTNGGTLLGQDGLRLDLPGTYQGNAQSRLLSDGEAVITAGRLNQSGEIAAGTLHLTTTTLDNSGRVLGSSGLTVTNRDELINRAGAELLTNGAGRVDSGTLRNAGTLQANDLQLRAGEIDNQGRIQGTDALRLLDVLRYVGNKSSQLLSNGVATLNAKQADNGGLWQAGTLTLDGDTFRNSGTVAGLNGLSLSGDALNNQGELFSQGAVTLTGKTLKNSGTLTGVGGFTLNLTDRVDNLTTGRLLSGGTGELTTGVLRNQGLWQSDALHLTARDLEQQGNLLGVQHGTLQLTGSYQGGQGSQLVSGGDLSLTAHDILNRGQVQGNTLTLGAEALDNHGSLRGDRTLNATVTGQFTHASQARLSSDGTLSVQAATLANQGEIKAATTTLTGNTITNGGTVQGTAALQLDATDRIVNQQGGQLLSDGTTTLNAAAVDNFGWLQGRGLALNTTQLTQQGSLMAQDKLTLTLPRWVNNGLVQAGELEIIADELDNHGTLLGLTQLALQTQRLINRQGAKLYSAQDLRLKTQELQQDGQLVALGNLSADITGPLTFTQTMAAGKQLTLNVAGDLDQRGTLQGQSVQLSSTGTLTHQGNILAGGGESRLSAKDIVQAEAGSIQAGGNLTLVSDNTLNNKGLIGTTGDLLVQAGGVLHNSSMLYAGGNMRLLSDSLTNVFGTILAGNNLWVQRDAQGNASTSLLNSSGTIETQSGDITINTGTLTNQREGLMVTESESTAESVPEWVGKTTVHIPIEWFKEGDYGILEDGIGLESGLPEYWWTYAAYEKSEFIKVALETSSTKVIAGGKVGIINSGGSFYSYSDFLLNNASQITAIKDIILKGRDFENRSYQEGYVKKYLTYKYLGGANFFANNDKDAIYKFNDSRYGRRDEREKRFGNDLQYSLYETSPTTEKTVGESYNALIQAGGTITADFKQDISNTTLQPGSGGFMPASTKPVLDVITTLSPLQKQTTRQLVSQDSSFNAGAVDVTKAGSGQATLADNTAGVNATGKTVTLTQQASTALQAGTQADKITTAIAAPNTAGPLTLNTGDAVVLQPAASGHISNPDAVTLTPQSGTALQTGAQAENITATITTPNAARPLTLNTDGAVALQPSTSGHVNNPDAVALTPQSGTELQTGAQADNITATITAPNTTGPLTLNTGDAVALQPSTSGHVSNPDAVVLSSTGQRPDAGKSLTPVNVDNTATGVTIAGTVGTPVVLATPGSVAVETLKPTVNADSLPGGATPAVKPLLSAADLLSAIGNGLQNLSTNPLAEYPLPTGNNGLLVVDPDADSRYLIHTNPKLEQLGQVDNALFSDLQTLLGQQPSTVVPVETRSQWTQADRVLGSSYLLDKLNLDADHDYRFLGDAEFDTRYISQAVLKQSGQRYLNGTGSDLQQMQTLLDNAAAAQTGMNLQLGVSLTPDQVANLSQSLVWWENIEVNGQTVLAPKLYLAQADKSNLQGSAIVANKVELNAGGSVTNSGTLRAVDVLAIASGDRIDNHEGGLIKSDGGLNLVALNNITNSGSRIEGNTLQLASINGDIINRTESRNFQTAQPTSSRSGTGSLVFTELGKTAEIVAGNSLTLSAGKDIRNVAATLNAGQDMALNAKGNVAMEALTLTNNRVDIGWGSSNTALNTAVQGSTVTAGGTLKAVAGQDIQIDASALSGGTALTLAAGNDIRLTAQDTLKETLYQGGSTAQRRTQDVANSQLLTGGDLNLVAGRDVLSEAASLNAKGSATLAAGRDLNLLSQEEETYSGNWWNRHADWQQNITQQSTELTAGKGLNLQAGRDINLQAAQGVASGAVTAQAGNNINLLSATETQHTFFEETQVKKKRFSKTVTHTLQETLQTNEKGSLLSGDGVTMAANQDINLQGSSVVGDKQVTLLANNDVNTAASVENYQNYEEHSKKKSGLFSGGGIGFTIGSTSTSQKLRDQAATQSQSISTLGSTTDSVTVKAGNDVTISGTDMVAGKDIFLQGNNVTIDPGYDTRKQQQEFEQKTAGLTVALSGVVGSALNSAVQSIQAAKSESDGRLALLQGMKAGLAGYQAYQGSQSELNNKGEASFVGVSISLGAQNSRSSQTSEQKQSFGSTLNAAGDIGIESRIGDITVAGSQLKAGGDVLMNAAQDIHLLSARNSEDISGKNSSSGGNIGISLGLSNGSAGLSIFANVNAAKGRETGTGNSWSETTVDAGNHVTLKSERDTRLIGAQVNGERIDVDAGRNLLLQSQQDSERYDSKQTSVAAGGSFTWGSMSGSGYLSASKDKIHSNYDSVQQQTGFFAGKDGFGIKTGEHTQLDAAVIGSTASAEKNRLETGTLGWSGLNNKAEFKVEHSGIGLSASPSMSGSMLSTLAMTVPSALMSLGNSGSAASTTYAAVSDGTLLLRDTAKQVQDIATLSRDVEHANNALSPIFNKEKEQKRLKQAQLIGEIGAQVMDIVRTEGELKAQKAAEAKGDSKVERPKDGDSAKEWEVYKKALTESPTYKAEMQKYGTGSDFQRAAQAATAAIQALAGGDIQKAIASGASPYLAQLVKDVTLPKDESKITASDIAANAMAHAVVGAVVAQLSGQDAAAGAIGASSGELAARAIMADQYPGKTANDLTEEEKQSVSALSTLASGLVSGLASNSTASAASGAQSGRNAVENNLFGKVLVEGCAIAAPCRTKVAEQLLEIGVKAGITAVVAKEIADKLSTEELEHLITLKMMGNDEITVRYLSSLQDKYLPSHTGGDQIAESGPTNTGGNQLPEQGANHTGNDNGQINTGPNHTGGDQIVGQLPNNTGNTESVPDLPSNMISDGLDNGAEKPSNIKVADDKYLKKNGVDAHQIKKDFLGSKAEIKLYDIYVDKDSGQLWIFRKGGKGEGVPTGEFINN